MLSRLYIQNYVLIDELDVRFDHGLTTVTGETGAGKSIILGALSLILGERADSKALRSNDRKCIVEGSFDIRKYALQSFFEANNLDDEHPTLIRREINPAGKSRAFINDTPVGLTQLKELASQLVDIHSQHDSRLLNNAGYQLTLLDAYAGQTETVDQYLKVFNEYKQLVSELEELQERERQSRLDEDYFKFQWTELEEAALQSGELLSLEEELETLSHAEEIKRGLYEASIGLSNDESGVVAKIREISIRLNKISHFQSKINEASERLNSTLIELEDLAGELDGLKDEINHDPQRAEHVSDRLDIILRLQQKHNVNSESELLVIMEELDEKLQSLGSLEQEIEVKLAVKDKLELKLSAIADTLSEVRAENSAAFESDVAKLLVQLGMKEATLSISLEKLGEFTSTGKDKIQFLFSANKGSEHKPLHKVASGGELSRLMLCLKYILSDKTELPTVIFDEIDTGVSGDIADRVGGMMRTMAKTMQVLSITHLPQIAGKGHQHFKVVKETLDSKTISTLKTLDEQERVDEIARMLSGRELTGAAVEQARELLKS